MEMVIGIGEVEYDEDLYESFLDILHLLILEICRTESSIPVTYIRFI